MKTISVNISDDSIASDTIRELNAQIPDSTRKTQEFQILFSQVTNCIKDFSEKANRLARSGTTIHIVKEFTLPYVNIFITLNFPKTLSRMDKLKIFFKKS